MTFFMKPEYFSHAYLELVEIFSDHGNDHLTYKASPRDGIIDIDSEGVLMSEQLEKAIFLWRMKYS